MFRVLGERATNTLLSPVWNNPDPTIATRLATARTRLRDADCIDPCNDPNVKHSYRSNKSLLLLGLRSSHKATSLVTSVCSNTQIIHLVTSLVEKN